MSAVLTILILVFADCITFWIISSQIKSNRLEDNYTSVSHLLLLLKECGNISATFTILTNSFPALHALYQILFFILDTTPILKAFEVQKTLK